MKKIDLHTHTTASDGLLSPSALVDRAVAEGVSALVIADHDTTGGIEEAVNHAKNLNIDIIPGIEFSIDYEDGTFHLLGLMIDYKHEELNARVNRLVELRATRAERIVEDLNDKGYTISFDEVLKEADGAAIGKPHVARVLVRHGYAPSFQDVFKKFLEPGMPGHAPKEKIYFEESLELIKKAGGIPVLAHPASLNFESFDAFEEALKGYVAAGLEGLEAYAEMHTPDDAKVYAALAEKYNLIVTGGSDFHGDKKEELGFYQPGELIPESCYTSLIACHEAGS